jgi:hypothetical protein
MQDKQGSGLRFLCYLLSSVFQRFSLVARQRLTCCGEDEKKQTRMLTSKYGHDVGD